MVWVIKSKISERCVREIMIMCQPGSFFGEEYQAGVTNKFCVLRDTVYFCY